MLVLKIELRIMLHIVGLLPAVDSLTATPIPLDSIISLTWTPPFSLDIPGVDPDITGYCVGVVNPTSSLVIDTQYGITNTQYNYTVSPEDICDTYTFTVTPVNIVGNGTFSSVTQGILRRGMSVLTNLISIKFCFTSSIESTVLQIEITIELLQSSSNITVTINVVSEPSNSE